MKFTRHIGLWLILIALSFLIVPMLITGPAIVDRIDSEISMMSLRFDHDTAVKVVRNANSMFSAVFVDSGLMGTAEKGRVGERDMRESQHGSNRSIAGLASMTNGYLSSLSANVYSAFVRMAIIYVWLPFVLPFLIAAIVDGVTVRKIKIETFRMLSPVSYSIGMHLMIALAFFPLVYLVAPLPVTPMFMPIWTILFALPSMLVLSNTVRVS